MKQDQLARRLAKRANLSQGAAADQMGRLVSDLLERVRKGESAPLPGLGTFRPGRELNFQFENDTPRSPGKSKKGSK